jgi:hypothetical protein
VTEQDQLPEKRAEAEELRLALVMNGGVSLAVWIGGVTREIGRLLATDPPMADWQSCLPLNRESMSLPERVLAGSMVRLSPWRSRIIRAGTECSARRATHALD